MCVLASHMFAHRGGTGIAYISPPPSRRPRVLREIEGRATDYRSGVTRYKGGRRRDEEDAPCSL